MKPRLSGGGFLLVLLLLNSWRAAAQAPPAPQTDPVEGMCPSFDGALEVKIVHQFMVDERL